MSALVGSDGFHSEQLFVRHLWRVGIATRRAPLYVPLDPARRNATAAALHPKQEARARVTASRPSARRWPRKCRHQQRACSLAFALSQPVVPADEEGDAPASKRTPPRRTQTSVTGGGTGNGQKLQHERQFTRR